MFCNKEMWVKTKVGFYIRAHKKYHERVNTSHFVCVFWSDWTKNPFYKYLWICCFWLLNSHYCGVREPHIAPLQGKAVVWLQPSLNSVGLVLSMRWKATWSRLKRLKNIQPDITRFGWMTYVWQYRPIFSTELNFIYFLYDMDLKPCQYMSIVPITDGSQLLTIKKYFKLFQAYCRLISII